MLGVINVEGKAAKPDLVAAHMWLNLCASAADGKQKEIAAQIRDEIAKQMKPQQLQEAERLAKEWKSKQTP